MQHRREETAEGVVEQCEKLRIEFGIPLNEFVIALLDLYKDDFFDSHPNKSIAYAEGLRLFANDDNHIIIDEIIDFLHRRKSMKER
jgi:hypothetical protein